MINTLPFLKDTFDLIGEIGWSEFTLAELAERGNISISELPPSLTRKEELWDLFFDFIDNHSPAAPLEGSLKDQVFEIFMNRFDFLVPFRKGLKRCAQDLLKDPLLLSQVTCNSRKSLYKSLEKLSLQNPLKLEALWAAYVYITLTWYNDDTPDQSLTMVTIDKTLSNLFDWENKLTNFL